MKSREGWNKTASDTTGNRDTPGGITGSLEHSVKKGRLIKLIDPIEPADQFFRGEITQEKRITSLIYCAVRLNTSTVRHVHRDLIRTSQLLILLSDI